MRDDKRKRDPGKNSSKDHFWTSFLKITKSETKKPPEEPERDDWDAILDDALREAQGRMEGEKRPENESEQPKDNETLPDGTETLPDGGETAPERGETLPEDGNATAHECGETLPKKNPTLPADPAPAAAPAEPADIRRGGMLLKTYRVESDMIGKGGMGAVWKVRHMGWDTDLAMKRPKPEAFRTEKQKESFIRECDCWIKLGLHPNIVSCYYVREIDGVPTIFSEWMENGDLEGHIKKGTLYEGTDDEVRERMLDVAIQFARGLRYAHDNNLIHQDVKPDNLLLTKDWEAKVSDFGIARARSQLTVLEGEWTQREFDSNATQMSPSGGMTPAYCSPEQAAHQLLTRRTDIYSWAVSVLEMYLGYKPWAQSGALTGPIAGLACRDYFGMCTEHPIPAALQELLAKCLAQEPDERPHDFGAVEAELHNIYRAETGKDYPRPEPKAAADTADSLNNRALSFLDLGRPQDAEAYWDSALRQTPDHPATLFNSALYQWRRHAITRHELERRMDGANWNIDETGLSKRWKGLIDAEYADIAPHAITFGEGRDGSNCNERPLAAISPDQKWIYAAFHNKLGCWNVRSMEQRFFVQEEREPRCDFIMELIPTSDGRRLLVRSGYGSIWLADAVSGETLRYLMHDVRPKKPTNNRKLGGQFVITEEERQELLRPSADVVKICVHPDNTHCYVFLTTNGSINMIRTYDLLSGTLMREYRFDKSKFPGALGFFCVGPKGDRLYIGTGSGTLAVLDAKDCQRVLYTEKLPFQYTTTRFSDDGEKLYCGLRAGSLYIWNTAVFTSEIVALPGQSSKPQWLSRDAGRIITKEDNGVFGIWDLERRESLGTIGGPDWKAEECLDASDDLTLLVVGGRDNSVLVWRGGIRPHRTPWELSQIKSYKQQINLQNDAERRTSAICSCMESGDITQALKLLDEAESLYDPHRFLPERRKLMEYCRRGELKGVYEAAQMETGQVWELTPDPDGDSYAAFIENTGNRADVAFLSDTGALRTERKLEEDASVRRFDIPDYFGMCYSRTGRLLAVMREELLVWDTNRELIVAVLKDDCPSRDLNGHNRMAFSPDDRWLAFLSGEGNVLTMVDTRDWTTRRTRKLEKTSYNSYHFCFTPSGEKIILLNEKGVLFVYENSAQFALLHRMQAIDADAFAVQMQFSPDGDRLCVRGGRVIDIWDAECWKKTAHFEFNRLNNLSISPDFTLAAVWTDTVRLCTLPDFTMSAELPLLSPSDLVFSADSSMLYALEYKNRRGYFHAFVLPRDLTFPGWTDRDEQAERYVYTMKKAFGKPEEEQIQFILREMRRLGMGFFSEEKLRTMLSSGP